MTKPTTKKPAAKCNPASRTPAKQPVAKRTPARKTAAQMLRNPAPRHTGVTAAKKAFEEFTGHPGEVIGEIEIPDMPKTVWVLGELTAVCYEATRDGITEQYMHEFNKKHRPLLCVAPDGKQLIVAGGRYKVTERGIEG